MRKKLLLTLFVIFLILSIFSATMIGVTAAEIHDIAVVSVTPSPTFVKIGDSVNITVIIDNQGTVDETNFNVTVYYDDTIETKTVTTLEAGANTSLTFTWDTTDVKEEIYATEHKEKTYIIKATASTVPGETDTEDNTGTCDVRVISQYITVLPQSTVDTTLTPGKNYTVSIYTDYNETDVWGYEFTLTYNPAVLEGTDVTNGDLVTEEKIPGSTVYFYPGTFDNVNGKLSLTGAKFDYTTPPAPLTCGPGTLANITFTVVGTGDSNLIFGETYPEEAKLRGVTEEGHGEVYAIIDDITPDLHHLVRGYFRNIIEEPVHDIVVVSVTPSNTSVEAGESVDVTVVIKNDGTVSEKGIKVNVYYDNPVAGYLIGTQTVSALSAGASKSQTFTWNTTGVGEGTHTVIAVAIPVHGETDTEDNTRVSPSTVTVKLPPEPPLPIKLIIGVVVVAVVVIVVVAYAAKRRKKPTLK